LLHFPPQARDGLEQDVVERFPHLVGQRLELAEFQLLFRGERSVQPLVDQFQPAPVLGVPSFRRRAFVESVANSSGEVCSALASRLSSSAKASSS
jgi:hypothetical protein